MAHVSRVALSAFALLATSALWFGCSDDGSSGGVGAAGSAGTAGGGGVSAGGGAGQAGSGSSGGFGGSKCEAGMTWTSQGCLECWKAVGAVGSAISDYSSSHRSCTVDSECTVVSHFQIPPCLGVCEIAIRTDAVAGLDSLGDKLGGQYCGTVVPSCTNDPYKYYQEFCDTQPKAAECVNGKCSAVPVGDVGDAGDAGDGDAG